MRLRQPWEVLRSEKGLSQLLMDSSTEIDQHGLADDQAAAIAEGLSIRDMHQQYELAKRYSFMERLR